VSVHVDIQFLSLLDSQALSAASWNFLLEELMHGAITSFHNLEAVTHMPARF
jgi:hypothetical protein